MATEQKIPEIIRSSMENIRSMVDAITIVGDPVTATGGTVIISHGMGIYSYYFHLTDITVAEGTTVQKGAILGKAGVSPLSMEGVGNIAHTAVSVGSVFVDAAPFIEGKIFIEQ